MGGGSLKALPPHSRNHSAPSQSQSHPSIHGRGLVWLRRRRRRRRRRGIGPGVVYVGLCGAQLVVEAMVEEVHE